MGRSRSDQLRKEWKRRQDNAGSTGEKRDAWQEAKQENEQVHIHFVCTCLSCAQQFMICGLPCFVICPNCHLVLNIRFS